MDRTTSLIWGRPAISSQGSWDDALNKVLARAVLYYESTTPGAREMLFEALYALTRYQFWSSGLEPALEGAFWDEKGILPVVLSFRGNRPLASNCRDAYCVLAGAMARTRRNGPKLHHLFLFAWTAFVPPVTAAQAERIEIWKRALPCDRDRRYDECTAVLLPQMRYLLRA